MKGIIKHTALFCMWLSGFIILAHAVIPHIHHHHPVEITHCEGSCHSHSELENPIGIDHAHNPESCDECKLDTQTNRLITLTSEELILIASFTSVFIEPDTHSSEVWIDLPPPLSVNFSFPKEIRGPPSF